MKTSIFVLTIAIFLRVVGPASGSEIKYKFSDIPEDLKKNAKSVIRKSIVNFEIINASEARRTIEYAVTVINKNGIEDAVFMENYDKFIKVKNIRAAIYNANGEMIKRYNGSDVVDVSAKQGYSLFEDHRIKAISPDYRTFPYTFEYSCEIEYNGILSYPNWYIYEETNMSVEQSSMQLFCHKGFTFRYLERNLPIKAEITENKEGTIYSWAVKNMPALKEEPMSTNFISNIPVIFFAPNDFEYGGSKGNAETWEKLGLWQYGLNEKRDLLIPETQQKIKELIKDAKDEQEKIKILYEYLQNKTRYVNITIGIGGWQPIEALTVDRLSYGDCKALTNYMKSLLAIAGIKSFYTLVKAGSRAEPILRGFPSAQFNHAILCVPEKGDTIWLECTSQHDPCGYEGNFTDDRDVLLINETGGHIVHTKCYTQEETRKISKTEVQLNDEGSGKAKSQTLYSGLYYDIMDDILFSDAADRQKLISNRIDIPSFKIVNYSHNLERERIPIVHETLQLELPNYATKISDRMIIPMNLMNKEDELSKQIGERKSDVLIRRAYAEWDSITYTLPFGYKTDMLPEEVKLNNRFGEYSASIQQLGNGKILYVRNFKMNKGMYAPASFDELKVFYEKVSSADHNIKLIVKKTS